MKSKKLVFMKKIIITLMIFCLPTICFAEWQGNINGYIGKKKIADSSMDEVDLDNMTETGIEIDFGKTTWPVNVVMGVFEASDDSSYEYMSSRFTGNLLQLYEYTNHYFSIELDTTAALIGIKKEFTPEAMSFFHAYIAGGGTAIKYDIKLRYLKNNQLIATSSNNDWCYGGWVETGFYFTALKNLNLGAAYRYTKADGEKDLELGGNSMNLILGYRF